MKHTRMYNIQGCLTSFIRGCYLLSLLRPMLPLVGDFAISSDGYFYKNQDGKISQIKLDPIYDIQVRVVYLQKLSRKTKADAYFVYNTMAVYHKPNYLWSILTCNLIKRHFLFAFYIDNKQAIIQ